MTKSDTEIMEILEAYDLTGTVWSAATLTGHDPKTVKRYVEARNGGRNPYEREPRPKMIDAFLEKVEEWVEQSKATIRADVVHEKLVKMGYRGSARSTRRAVNAANWRGRRASAGRTGRGFPSRAGGCSSTGARVRGSRGVGPGCSAHGCPGRGSGS